MYIMLLLILSNVFGDSAGEMNAKTMSHIYAMLCYAELMRCCRNIYVVKKHINHLI